MEVGFLFLDAGGVLPFTIGAFSGFDGAEAGLAVFGGFLPVERQGARPLMADFQGADLAGAFRSRRRAAVGPTEGAKCSGARAVLLRIQS